MRSAIWLLKICIPAGCCYITEFFNHGIIEWPRLEEILKTIKVMVWFGLAFAS